MKRLYTSMIILFCICFSFESIAQYNPRNVCRIDGDRTIFKLDRRWTEKQRKEVRNLFDLDSLLLAAAFRGAKEIVIDGSRWQIKPVNKNVVEVSKEMNTEPAKHISTQDIFIFDDLLTNLTNLKTQESATFGVNDFKRNFIFEYKNNIAQIFLPNNIRAHKVYVSGTFNNWSTTQLPMRQIPSGWLVNIKLLPGKYLYKFIIDGKWTDDPNNNLRESDLQGGKNSVLYCPNYQFTLRNHNTAQKAILTGSFNNWNTNQLKMTKTPTGWIFPAYLKDGMYSYKFIVDNTWITDPDNKTSRADGNGNINSVIGIGKSYLFQLNGFLTARYVVLSGSFNGWKPEELPMESTRQGWKLSYILAPGNYEYKFIVEGKWITDPANPYYVGSGNERNSFLAFRPNHTFELDKYPNAKSVIISGDFNNWSEDGYQMVKKEGKWTFPIRLSPGKHIYKFIVDKSWILDPANRLWEPNQYGTNNSVIWIEP